MNQREEALTVLGIFSVEALGFLLDPLRRELKPLPMILAIRSSGKEG